MSLDSPLSSFSFFFLFLLLEYKCLRRRTKTCRNGQTISLIIDEIEHSQLFWIHTTFLYLRFGKGKRFNLWGIFNSLTVSFYGWFFSFSWSSSVYSDLFLTLFRPKLRIFYEISRTHAGISARRFSRPINHLFFFLHTAESRHSIAYRFNSLKCKGYN